MLLFIGQVMPFLAANKCRESHPALNLANRNRLRGTGLRSRAKAPVYEELGTKPAAKVRCQLPPGQVASRE